MSKKTPNIGLALNGVKSEDTQMTFREWRLRVNGEDNDSNMEILDAEIGAAKEKITELEGRSLSDEDKQKLAKIKDMVPATANKNGEAGFVPAPQSGDQVRYLRGDGTWGVPEGTNTPATGNADGLMSKEDKQKLDQFASADQYAKKDDVPKNVETDTTLTKASTPADAKAVGDRIGSLTANDVGAMPKNADVVKTVNGKQPDQNGDIQIAETDGNIHIGSDNPPDETYVVWIDPDGEPTEIVDQYAREQLENKLDNTTTAADIGALPSSTVIPSKTSELQNDSGFVAGTDATLAIAGEAADAKATGDALGQLNTEIEKKYSTEVLWENAAPNSAFDEQTVTFDWKGYNYCMIYFLAYVDSNVRSFSSVAKKGDRLRFYFLTDTTHGAGGQFRDFYSDTSHFGKAVRLTDSTSIDQNACVPIGIYGVKGV